MDEITLTEEQSNVLHQLHDFATGFMDMDVATISGYAGTGKTTVVSKLVAALDAKVLVSAPTNKAVDVLAGKIPSGTYEAKTIHAALGLRPRKQIDGKTKFVRDENVKCTLHEYDIAIIDEASMVSDEMLRLILKHRRNCKILFVGDPAQLPPVDDSNTISSVFNPDVVSLRFALKTVVRQAMDNPVIAYATLVRTQAEDCSMPTLATANACAGKNDERFIVASGGDTTLREWMVGAHQNGLQTRILAYTNQSIDGHNAAIHNALYPGVPGFAAGEPVVINDGCEHAWFLGTNTKARLTNGELLEVSSCELAQNQDYPDVPCYVVTFTDGRCVYAPVNRLDHQRKYKRLFDMASQCKLKANQSNDGNAERRLNAEARSYSFQAYSLKESFADISHAYAMTVHKSQGSTFNTVLFDWTASMRTMQRQDQRNAAKLLYVAATRASQNFCIVT